MAVGNIFPFQSRNQFLSFFGLAILDCRVVTFEVFQEEVQKQEVDTHAKGICAVNALIATSHHCQGSSIDGTTLHRTFRPRKRNMGR